MASLRRDRFSIVTKMWRTANVKCESQRTVEIQRQSLRKMSQFNNLKIKNLEDVNKYGMSLAKIRHRENTKIPKAFPKNVCEEVK